MRRRRPPERTKSRLAMASAIRVARSAAGLTQEALGLRLGLKGRAVYRWERADSVPSRRHQRALVIAIQAIQPATAARLAAALASANASEGKAGAPIAVPSPVPAYASLELAMFGLAEDLELAPRRVRSALLPFLRRLRGANVTLEAAEQLLASALQTAQPAGSE